MFSIPTAVAGACRAFGIAAVLASPLAAHAQTFDAKPGAWEMTTTMTGAAVPPDVLAKMPPDRRAMVEKLIAENGGANGQKSTRQSCVSKADLDSDNFGRPSNQNDCKTTTTSRTPSKIVMATSCGGPPPLSGTITFEAKTPTSVVGSIDQQRPDGSTFHVGIVGKWLRASCDGVDPSSRTK